ncbi:chemotaxis protein CheB [Singulisphaera sp. PoT]|uniref:chemotaxis protein CheB n=1 Tax=Singulisphaera sp. PoT TaxID=3411797 RepID=UPI003BF56C77
MTPTRVEPEAVVVGASSGAVEALSALLPALPADYPLPLIVVVHVPPHRSSLLSELFRSKCRVPVREAEDKEPIEPGTVYFAPPDYHVLVELDGRLSLSSDELVAFSRPSIDVLFETAADAYGPSLIGVVLTGANADGANGLRAVLDAGVAIVQDPADAQSSEMPRAALGACPEARALGLEQIAAYLMEVVKTS